jgi:hypothetical protein
MLLPGWQPLARQTPAPGGAFQVDLLGYFLMAARYVPEQVTGREQLKAQPDVKNNPARSLCQLT